jgi:hypothetical protein
MTCGKFFMSQVTQAVPGCPHQHDSHPLRRLLLVLVDATPTPPAPPSRPGSVLS